AVRRHGGDFETYLAERNAKAGKLPTYLVKVREGNEETVHYFHDESAVRRFHQENLHLNLLDTEPGQELLPLSEAPVRTDGSRRRGRLEAIPGQARCRRDSGPDSLDEICAPRFRRENSARSLRFPRALLPDTLEACPTSRFVQQDKFRSRRHGGALLRLTSQVSREFRECPSVVRPGFPYRRPDFSIARPLRREKSGFCLAGHRHRHILRVSSF